MQKGMQKKCDAHMNLEYGQGSIVGYCGNTFTTLMSSR